MSVVSRKLPKQDEAPPKLEQIVDAAYRLLLEDGDELNSMDAGAIDANVSTFVVCSYFKNRKPPFIDIMEDICHLFGEGVLDTINFDGPPDNSLQGSARFLLPEMMNSNPQSPGPDSSAHHSGHQFPGDEVGRFQIVVADYLQNEAAAGMLRAPEPSLPRVFFTKW